ncbi:MAG: ABC transporter ATP-binding protein [Proteobacteria bacterium]|nr:ABC transporter ATP-binding protein [Pseudomonadota bacterium]
MALIETENLVKTYRLGDITVRALNGVTLSVGNEEFVVLAGRSGSGKTTLLNMLGALDMPDSGTVRIKGEEFINLSKDARALFRLRHIGFVFQAYNLIRVLSARENVAYVLELQGVPKSERHRRADHWLNEVGLGDMGDRRHDQLSGGQQQRVAVARALAAEPDIVLADEPTANLDSGTGQQLLDTMRHLNEVHKTTFVFASHDPVVIGAAKRLVRLDDGRIASDEIKR